MRIALSWTLLLGATVWAVWSAPGFANPYEARYKAARARALAFDPDAVEAPNVRATRAALEALFDAHREAPRPDTAWEIGNRFWELAVEGSTVVCPREVLSARGRLWESAGAFTYYSVFLSGVKQSWDKDVMARVRQRVACLRSAIPTLSVRSEPPHAAISIAPLDGDSWPIGQAPAEFGYAPGNYLLRLKPENAQTYTSTAVRVTLAIGKHRSIFVELRRRVGVVEIRSSLRGAKVRQLHPLEGALAQARLNEPFERPVGRYRFEVGRQGYRPRTLSVDVRWNAPSLEVVDLEPLNGCVHVLQRRPDSLTITTTHLKTRSVQEQRCTEHDVSCVIERPEGAYRLKFASSGYETGTKTATISWRQAHLASVNLAPQRRGLSTARTLLIGSGAMLLVGGIFGAIALAHQQVFSDDPARRTYDQATRYALVADVALGSSAVGGLTALVLWLIDRSDQTVVKLRPVEEGVQSGPKPDRLRGAVGCAD